MNKKLFFLINIIAVLFVPIFAEIADPHRYVEFGVEGGVGVSNNYFAASELLVKDVVIDLNKIANEISDEGLILDFDVKSSWHFSIDKNSKFRLKVFMGIEGNGYGNVSQDFFKLIGNGISENTFKKIDVKLYGDIFAQAGVSYKTEIKGYGVRFTPTFFAPILHVADTNATVYYRASDTGHIKAEADLPVNIYSLFSLEGLKANSVDSAFVQDALGKAIRAVGFDFEGAIEKKLTETFDIALFSRLPLVPGRLKYKTTKRYWGYFEQNNLLGYLNGTQSGSKDYGSDEMVYGSAYKLVHRPFILGVEGAWRPFGDWCVFRPKLNLAVRNPWSSEAQLYGEYNLSANFSLFKIIGLNFATAYENFVFKQTMGIMLNARVVEIDAYFQLRGGDFAKSFSTTGAATYIALKVGY
ncbi:hypothetical protein [Treponema pectinovorum]|uniref:hypothetical protein n=1 Tax=Treponema pectinovorum TaxID=164 RepID=UPI003D8D6D20